MSPPKPRPCWFLAPTRDCPPDGRIALGNIVISAELPDEPLNTSPAPLVDPSAISTHNTRDWSLNNSKTDKGRVGVWASFLQVLLGVGGGGGGRQARDSTEQWTVRSMSTRTFVPSQAYVEACLQQEPVHHYIVANRFRAKVYMITGVMVASGASGCTRYMRERGLYAHLGVDATSVGVPLSVGPEVEISQGRQTSVGFGDADDFVFAFRLREIQVRKGGEVRHRQFKDGALFDLDGSYEKRPDDKAIAIEVQGITDEDARGEDFNMIEMEAVEDGSGEECLCGFTLED